MFSSSRSGKGDIYTVKPDGSDLRRLTASNAIETSPVWSPDGTQLAYISTAGGFTHVCT